MRATLPEQARRGQVTVLGDAPPPGEQAQIDYGRLGMWLDPGTGRRPAVWAFVMVLACSGHLFVRPTLAMDQAEWTAAHVEAFAFFGGVPARLVPDNLKTGVDRPNLYDPKINRSYAELAAHYGTLVDPARAAKPRDKPQVERPMPYVRFVLARPGVHHARRPTATRPTATRPTATRHERTRRLARHADPPGDRGHQRPDRRAAHAQARRDAADPRRSPAPGPRRRTRAPGVPAGAVSGRDLPPRDHRHRPPHPTGPVRADRHPGGFDFTANPKLPAAQIRDLATLRWLQAGESVILHGPIGVGKTHIAQALAYQAIRAGAEARFAKTSRILAELAGGHADGTWTRRLRELARPAVLLLDDFAMRELTPTQADDLYELINERAGRSLILTSNRSPIDWYPLFPNPVVAESLLDRLINNSHQLLINGASYWPRTRPGRVADQGTTTTR